MNTRNAVVLPQGMDNVRGGGHFFVKIGCAVAMGGRDADEADANEVGFKLV